ncbi:MAG TPA: adenylate/guanylate cyclase domain-containing protein [Candidatus Limnocylindrales bacterium]|nr:adenylate/guanylate cyclase domain-containing protein [Candidatus Limnocylindrales bacterium]
MARLQARVFDSDADRHAFPNGLAQILQLGDTTVARGVYQPGWRWTTDMPEIAGTPTCHLHHLGYAISGGLRVLMDDGQTIDVAAGSVYEIPPGHDAWVLGDEPFVTIDWTSAHTWLAQGVLPESVVVTIVLTDIVDSTATLQRVGDWAWRELLATHNARLREHLNMFRGRLVKSTGDGILAIFDSPSRAVRSARAMAEAARATDLPIRVGVHTGEVELVGDDVRGLAVHAAARVMALGGAGDVMVSSTTHDLLEGSNLVLEDAGTQELKGLSGLRKVYRMVR